MADVDKSLPNVRQNITVPSESVNEKLPEAVYVVCIVAIFFFLSC